MAVLEQLSIKMAKISEQRHLRAIRDGIVSTLPLIIVGSIFLILAFPPFPKEWAISVLAKKHAVQMLLPYRMTMFIMGLYAVMGIGYSLAKSYKLDGITGAILSVCAFLLTIMPKIIDPNDTEDHVFTGAELNELTDEEFQKVFKQYSVYARVSPEHKVRIVKAWQNEGKVVAMTGDGVNDAPSLKTADIGIGMGITGTEVSKGASDMVLADDNFATIIVAVEEGRKVFSNIQKSIQYLLSANMAEVFTIFFATLLGWDVLQPVHLLWINLVTDTLPAIALGVEPAEPGVMTHKPRGRKSNFFDGGVFGAIIYQGIFQTMLVLGVYGWALLFPEHQSHTEIHADALTMAFATLGLIQLLHAFNVKSVYQSIFKVGLFTNKTFNWSIPVAFVLFVVTILVPGFNNLFHVSNLSLTQWMVVAVGALMIVVLVEIVKAVQRALGKDKNAI